MKKTMMFLLCIFMFNLVSITPAVAMGTSVLEDAIEDKDIVDMFALKSVEVNFIESLNISALSTTSLDWNISAGELKKSDTGLSLEAGEMVSINATFSPKNADIDFGLIAPDGRFYYITGSNGKFNKAIRVNENGEYHFAVRNNSIIRVNVVGFVYY